LISNYNPYHVPRESFSSLLVEITVSPKEINYLDTEKTLDDVIDGLKKLGLISESENEILFYRLWIHRYGYPVHTHRILV